MSDRDNYDEYLQKKIPMAEPDSVDGSTISGLDVSNVGAGGIQRAWKFGERGSIEMYDENNKLVIFIGFIDA